MWSLNARLRGHGRAFIAHTESLDLWHRRLGHLSYPSVKKLEKKNLVLNLKLENNDITKECEACLLGKQARLPTTHREQETTEVLQLIHSDVVGPVTPASIGGNKYFVIFVDDFSRKVWAYPHGYIHVLSRARI